MWLIIEEIVAALGAAELRLALTEAAKELTIKFGRGAVTSFLKGVAKEELKGLTKQEIVALAELELKKGAKVGFDKAVFSKSNAKQLANIINKGVSFIDEKTKQYAIKRLARIQQKQFVELLAQNMNVPTDLGRGTFQVLGGDVPGFGFLSAKQPGKFGLAARNTFRWGLETALFPMTKGQAFTAGYIRGIAGGTTVGAIDSLVTTLPRQALLSPRYRAFFRAMTAELDLFKAYKLSGVSTAEQLFNAVKISAKAAKDIGISESFAKETIAGNIAGRLTVPVFSTYVFTNKDDRKKKIENFKRSVPDFARKQARVYVDSYIRQDGTKVHGYYRVAA